MSLRQPAACPYPAGVLLAGTLLLGGCRHHAAVAYTPPPPPATSTTHASSRPAPAKPTPTWKPTTPGDLEAEADAAPPGYFDDFHARPVFTETGMASWYGANGNHRTADGSVYDSNGMFAAHRTLPLGSTARITNLVTGEQVLVRITDRGPFAPGRVLDLSLGAARAVGLYRLGVARVRVEAYPHASADPAGRWCVQTGAFKQESDALDLKAALLLRYHAARVAEFAGATGFWVRIDPATRAKTQAEEIAAWIGQPDPLAHPYLVRTD